MSAEASQTSVNGGNGERALSGIHSETPKDNATAASSASDVKPDGPKRALVKSLWESVLREQLPEGMYPLWQRLNVLASEWGSQDSDAPAREFVEGLREASAREEAASYLARAAKLTALVSMAFRTEPIDPPWSECTQMPHVESVAAELKAAEMRPLRSRPYPPYPQLNVVTSSDVRGEPMIGHCDGLAREPMHYVTSLIRNWDAFAGSPCPIELRNMIRGHLVRAWQSSYEADRDAERDTPRKLYSAFQQGEISDELASLNDSFANIVHIDPRFANFIPFGVGQTIHAATIAKPTSGSWLYTRLTQISDSSSVSQVVELISMLGLDQKYARYGSRTMNLHARLSIGNPEMAVVIEREDLGRHLAQCAHHILSRMAAFQMRVRLMVDTLDEHSTKSPGSIPALPPVQRSAAYTSSSQLLLDLKQLHQAVGEVYGGVAFTPAVRRVLIRSGLVRLHGAASNLAFEAMDVEDVASELGLRAGLLRDPLAAMSEVAANEAAIAMAKQPQKLSSVFDSGSLSEQAVSTLGYLRAARWLLANIDPEAVNCLVVSNISRASEAISALALMSAMDAEKLEHGSVIGNGLSDRLGLVMGLSVAKPFSDSAKLVKEVLDSAPMRAYVQSRGGHVEIMLQRETGSLTETAFGRTPSISDILRLRATVRAIVEACAGTTVTFTFAATEPWMIDRLIACFPSNTVNQHIRVICPSSLSRELAAVDHGVRQLFDAPLAELTRQSWLNRSIQDASSVEAEHQVLSDIENDRQRFDEECEAAGVSRKSYASWFAAIDPWFGARRLASVDVSTAPMEAQSHLETAWYRAALGFVADTMQVYHPRRLSVESWKWLPKGAYSRLFPVIEREWQVTKDALIAKGAWPKSPNAHQVLANAEAVLSMVEGS